MEHDNPILPCEDTDNAYTDPEEMTTEDDMAIEDETTTEDDMAGKVHAVTGVTERHSRTRRSQLRLIVFDSWIKIFLLCSPLSVIFTYILPNPVAVFILSLAAMIPLAAILRYTADEISKYIGGILGGLLNAFFGNIVELTLAIIGLAHNKEDLKISLFRTGSIIMLLVYLLFHTFRFCTHTIDYESPRFTVKLWRLRATIEEVGQDNAQSNRLTSKMPDRSSQKRQKQPQLSITSATFGLILSASFVLLCSVQMITTFRPFIQDLEIPSDDAGLILLLPFAGNVPKYMAAVTTACKDKINLSVNIHGTNLSVNTVIESYTQIALLLLPIAVIVGWLMKIHSMTLLFRPLNIAQLGVVISLLDSYLSEENLPKMAGSQIMSLFVLGAFSAESYRRHVGSTNCCPCS